MGSAHQPSHPPCVRRQGVSWGASGEGSRDVSARGPLGQDSEPVARERERALRALLHARAACVWWPGSGERRRARDNAAEAYRQAWLLPGEWPWHRIELHALHVSATRDDSGSESARHWRRREEWAA